MGGIRLQRMALSGILFVVGRDRERDRERELKQLK